MSDSLKSTAALLAFAIPFTFAPTQSFAQQPEASVLDEVIVTARRVSENLQDTPIAITALSAESLEERQIFRTDALDQVVPNLQFSNNAPLAGNNASSAIFIRGIGQTDPTSTVDPGVGLYIDDVYMGTAVGGTMDFRDIANVQVLRGPQGTLFGRNTIGGAILLTTTEPGDDFGGKVRVGAGSDSLGEFFGALDVPFSDTLKSRVSFGLRKQDGYVERNFDGEDLGDANTWTTTGQTAMETQRQLHRPPSMSTTPRRTRMARRWCSASSTRRKHSRAWPVSMPPAPAWPTTRSRCRPRPRSMRAAPTTSRTRDRSTTTAPLRWRASSKTTAHR